MGGEGHNSAHKIQGYPETVVIQSGDGCRMFRVQAVPYLPKASEMLSTGLQFYLQDTWHLVWRTRQIMKFIKWELNTALVLPMELWAEFSVREGVGSVKIDGLRSLFLD